VGGVILLVMTDGRDDVLAETLDVAAANVPHTRLVVHDDTGDIEHRSWLAHAYRHLQPDVIGGDVRRGFGGAIRAAWQHLATLPEPWVAHIEDDFLLDRPVDWVGMANVLTTHPHLVQLALRRQPWNPDEEAAGGIVEQHPDDYLDCTDGPHRWLEHTRFFTTNPSLYRRSLCDLGWPDGANSEGRFGINLLQHHPDWRFGFWGARDSGEWCRHIGHQRVGVGY
jgi:hypothetical protein